METTSHDRPLQVSHLRYLAKIFTAYVKHFRLKDGIFRKFSTFFLASEE